MNPGTEPASQAELSDPSRQWFARRYGTPSPVQERVWPLMATGRHILFSAPTGTGKTLAAFMPALDRLLCGDWPSGSLQVLYISPLKALNNDIRYNLMEPLEGMTWARQAGGLEVHPVRVMVRSGDTPAAERSRFQRKQPEILITTPESLGVLLNQKSAPAVFASLKLVILDEIHGVLESKRGSLLSLMLEKLELFAPGFQRVGISATVKPLDQAAAFLGGWTEGEKREVLTVEEPGAKSYGIEVALPRTRPPAGEEDGHYWETLGLELRKLVKERRRTLIFCNSRRACETLARFINGNGDRKFPDRPFQPPDRQDPAETGDQAEIAGSAAGTLVYPHHGSLSRELRLGVETGLKEGTLRGIVATSSLELGIDIGDLDQVVLVQAPASVSSALQRAGRSGHRPGDTSRLLVYPGWGVDSIRCAAMARSILAREIDSLRIPLNPLDVLAQGMLAFCLDQAWEADALYRTIQKSHSFHTLSRHDFDQVTGMLLGLYGEIRIAELKARLRVESQPGQADRLVASDQARSLLFSRGGSIPGRGSFVMRGPGGERLGELDEEFVWERRKGDRFLLGNRVWEIRQMDEQSVHVQPSGGFAMLPFWRGEELDLSFALSTRSLVLLDQAEFQLSRGSQSSLEAWLAGSCCLQAPAAAQLAGLLARQREALGVLPGTRRVVIETFTVPEREGDLLCFFHTFWGNKVNRPLCLLLARIWKDRTGQDLEYYLGNEGMLLILPDSEDPRTLLEAVQGMDIRRTLMEELTSSVWFAARFRENAGRAMLLGGGFGTRTPLWLLRRRAGKLLSALWKYPDFPLLGETWRQCLEDELEPEALAGVLEGLSRKEIEVHIRPSHEASPFAGGLMWKHTGDLMYQADQANPGLGKKALASRGMDQAGDGPDQEWSQARQDASMLRAFSAGDLDSFRMRLLPEGLAGGGDEPSIADFLERMRFLDIQTWTRLLGPEGTARIAQAKIHGGGVYSALAWKVRKACVVRGRKALDDGGLDDEGGSLEDGELSAIQSTGLPGLADLVADHLALSVPESLQDLSSALDLESSILHDLLEPLVEEGTILKGLFSAQSRSSGCLEYTVPDIFEALHRQGRRQRRRSTALVDIQGFAAFLASWQGLGGRHDQDDEVLRSGIRRLSFLPMPAGLWESLIFPLRFQDWQASCLDSLCLGQGLAWRGRGGKSRLIWWVFPEDEALVPPAAGPGGGKKPARVLHGALETPGSGKSGKAFESGASGVPGESGSPGISGLGSFLALHWDDHQPLTFSRLHQEIKKSVHPGESAGELEEGLWSAVFQGQVSNTDPALLRQALASDFRPLGAGMDLPDGRRRIPAYREWQLHRTSRGLWYPVPEAENLQDMEMNEILKERCRLVLDRYGIVHPALLAHEMPGFTWRDLSLTFRLLELSGEIEAGCFVQGLAGLQYASPGVLGLLEDPPFPGEFWIQAAQDPSSLCGSGLAVNLPARKAGTFLVWHRRRPLFAWHASGSVEDILPPAGAGARADSGTDPLVVDKALGYLLENLDRLSLASLHAGSAGPASKPRMAVKTVNGSPVLAAAAWKDRLGRFGFHRHGEVMIRFRKV